MYTAMFGGDVDLSASMTFSSTILAFGSSIILAFLTIPTVRFASQGTFPLWILLLGREFINTHNVHFP